jgi:ribose 5-phosphate isomerase A
MSSMNTKELKQRLGIHAANLVVDDMLVGLGTGSTVLSLIEELGRRVKDGLSIEVVPTSEQTRLLAIAAGLSIIEIDKIKRLDIDIDGADEIDAQGNLIKGGGGALLQEKIVAAASDRFVVIADQSKMVSVLGKFPLPVEVIPFGSSHVAHAIKTQLHCNHVELRIKDGKTFVTDHGHWILDCHFNTINDPHKLNQRLYELPGVVETGLFLHMATEWIIGMEDGSFLSLPATPGNIFPAP